MSFSWFFILFSTFSISEDINFLDKKVSQIILSVKRAAKSEIAIQIMVK